MLWLALAPHEVRISPPLRSFSSAKVITYNLPREIEINSTSRSATSPRLDTSWASLDIGVPTASSLCRSYSSGITSILKSRTKRISASPKGGALPAVGAPVQDPACPRRGSRDFPMPVHLMLRSVLGFCPRPSRAGYFCGTGGTRPCWASIH